MSNLWPPYMCTLEYSDVFMFLCKKLLDLKPPVFQISKFIIISTFIWILYWCPTAKTKLRTILYLPLKTYNTIKITWLLFSLPFQGPWLSLTDLCKSIAFSIMSVLQSDPFFFPMKLNVQSLTNEFSKQWFFRYQWNDVFSCLQMPNTF